MSVAEKTDVNQDNCPMIAEPQQEHHWLQQLVGDLPPKPCGVVPIC